MRFIQIVPAPIRIVGVARQAQLHLFKAFLVGKNQLFNQKNGEVK
jgi:hypothetical protein